MNSHILGQHIQTQDALTAICGIWIAQKALRMEFISQAVAMNHVHSAMRKSGLILSLDADLTPRKKLSIGEIESQRDGIVNYKRTDYDRMEENHQRQPRLRYS